MNLCFQKELKNFEEMCVYNHGDTYLLHFTFFPLHANSPSSIMQCILLETKTLPLISQMLAFLGSVFIIILTINIF